MTQTLPLKYRPQKLAQLIGQDLVVRILSNALKLDRLSHAYLFTGPRGCGKTSSARIFAKSLNCKQGPTIDPCGICQNCKEITLGISPDVIEMDAASHRGVEDAELMIERSNLAPQTAKHKVYIIDEVHMFSNHAFNALLKTIEEPPPNVIFILATTEEHKVPATISSRCQRFGFRPVQESIQIAYLREIASKEEIAISDQALRRIALLSQGGMRDALSLLDQASILGLDGNRIEEETVLELWGGQSDQELGAIIESILTHDPESVLRQIEQAFDKGIDPLRLLKNLIEHSVRSAESELAKTDDQSRLRELIRLADELSKGEFTLRNATQVPLKLKNTLLAAALGISEQVYHTNEMKIIKTAPIGNKASSPINLSSESEHRADLSKEVMQTIEPVKSLLSDPIAFKLEDYEQKQITESNDEPAEVISEIAYEKKPQKNQSELSGQELIQRIYEILPNASKKAAFKSAEISVLEMNPGEILFGVGNKNYFKIVNDPKSINMLEERVYSVLGRRVHVRLQVVEGKGLAMEDSQLPSEISIPLKSEESVQLIAASDSQTIAEDPIADPRNESSSFEGAQSQGAAGTEIINQTDDVNLGAASDGQDDDLKEAPKAPDSEFVKAGRYILGAKPVKR
ncbi:MAG: DNA polymerase III subunit gamma/tau [Candidatus Caenarcaniphilales bacterium]|nr:DNA polymerase III subunit gamma/tau [Candidatus Caenarcaniphilales bacterium]